MGIPLSASSLGNPLFKSTSQVVCYNLIIQVISAVLDGVQLSHLSILLAAVYFINLLVSNLPLVIMILRKVIMLSWISKERHKPSGLVIRKFTNSLNSSWVAFHNFRTLSGYLSHIKIITSIFSGYSTSFSHWHRYSLA